MEEVKRQGLSIANVTEEKEFDRVLLSGDLVLRGEIIAHFTENYLSEEEYSEYDEDEGFPDFLLRMCCTDDAHYGERLLRTSLDAPLESVMLLLFEDYLCEQERLKRLERGEIYTVLTPTSVFSVDKELSEEELQKLRDDINRIGQHVEGEDDIIIQDNRVSMYPEDDGSEPIELPLINIEPLEYHGLRVEDVEMAFYPGFDVPFTKGVLTLQGTKIADIREIYIPDTMKITEGDVYALKMVEGYDEEVLRELVPNLNKILNHAVNYCNAEQNREILIAGGQSVVIYSPMYPYGYACFADMPSDEELELIKAEHNKYLESVRDWLPGWDEEDEEFIMLTIEDNRQPRPFVDNSTPIPFPYKKKSNH